jgi:integrase
MGRVYLRGGRWWIQYHYRGQLRRESSGSDKPGKAVSLLKQRLGEIGQGRFVGPAVERTTFEDLAEMLIEDYKVNGRKTLDRAEKAVEHLAAFFARSLAFDITADRVSKYICSRLEVVKPATIRLELAALKRMFTLGLRAGKVASRPYFPSIEVRNTRAGFFEWDEFVATLSHLPEEARAVAEFLYLTGWRKGEALQLQWRQWTSLRGWCGWSRARPRTTRAGRCRSPRRPSWPSC